MAFGVIIISTVNITLAIKFPDVASLHISTHTNGRHKFHSTHEHLLLHS